MEIFDNGLTPYYRTYSRQKCFIGYSNGARWRIDIEGACKEVLQDEFNLEPWYAEDHPDPTRALREKVIEMIANTCYGIYDLSYWQKDNKEWVMPQNVFIELGIAIALNRPTLLLRHADNEEANLRLPICLESVRDDIIGFSGKMTLKQAFRERLPQWINSPPEQDWWNRYCNFGCRICEYREVYPYLQQWGQETLSCHISDGEDKDRPDFRNSVEEVLERYSNVTFEYLNELPITRGYDFLLCTHCQKVRSTPFAIYRITPHTSAETFIAIGMSLALEMQFKYEIPKILLTSSVQDIPSLLAGYEVVVAQNDTMRKARLQKFIPVVMQKIRETTWRPRPLPFEVILPQADTIFDRREVSEILVNQQVPMPIQAQQVPEPNAAPEAINIDMLKDGYEAVREGRIRDSKTIRELALRFEAVANDPAVDFDAMRAAQILYQRARVYEEEDHDRPVIELVVPRQGVQGTILALTIEGKNFRLPRLVRIVQNTSWIEATDIVSTDIQIQCKITIAANQKTGKWDLIVENEDGSQGWLEEAFEIHRPVGSEESEQDDDDFDALAADYYVARSIREDAQNSANDDPFRYSDIPTGVHVTEVEDLGDVESENVETPEIYSISPSDSRIQNSGRLSLENLGNEDDLLPPSSLIEDQPTRVTPSTTARREPQPIIQPSPQARKVRVNPPIQQTKKPLTTKTSRTVTSPPKSRPEKIIYLGPEEELTNVRERLENTDALHIILVIPPQTLLRSHVGWRLLRSRVRELGQDVLIISSDRQIRAIAKAAGFQVARSL